MEQMKARTVRVDDELWANANKKADQRGETVSSVIRRALSRYTGDFNDPNGKAGLDLFGGALVLTKDWSNDAAIVGQMFHMVGCEIELDGIDLMVKPRTDAFSPPESLTSVSINGNNFVPPNIT